jgi:hypothetical protein
MAISVPLFRTPPPVSGGFPTGQPPIPSGTVMLFGEKSWTSTKKLPITTSESLEAYTYAFKGTSLQNMGKWVVFNLPKGAVMTLLEFFTTGVKGQPFNFANCGRTLDLIGNGETQTIDLSAVGCGDCMTAYIWRNVDLASGGIQLFQQTNFQGVYATFFLSEWQKDTQLSLANWYLQNRASSVYFGALSNQMFTLNTKADFSGKTISFAGWLSNQSTGVPDLSVYGLNDTMGGWVWSMRSPLTVSFEPFSPEVNYSADGSMSITSTISGTNAGRGEITDSVAINCEGQQSVTVSMTESMHVGGTLSIAVGLKFEAGTETNKSEMSFEITLGLALDYTKEQSKSLTATKTIDISNSQTIVIPAGNHYTSMLTMNFARILPSSYTTEGTFYYDVPVPGSVLDSKMSESYCKPIYGIKQTVSGRISGGVAANMISNTQMTPIE